MRYWLIGIIAAASALAVEPAQAQQKRALQSKQTDSIAVQLKDGDYVTVAVSQTAEVDVAILDPRGSIVLRNEGPSGEEKYSLAFAAEAGGAYTIKLTNPGERAVDVELRNDVVPLDVRLNPPPAAPAPDLSPRIIALKSQVASGRRNTDAFWNEVTAQGTPIVEPIPADAKHQLVTFLWRNTYDTRNVLVIGSFWGIGAPDAYAMRKIPDTDVWYLTLKMPTGARFTYTLSPNDPMTDESPRASQRDATRQADPLSRNPLSACPPGTTKFDCASVAELPGGGAQPWLIKKAGVAAGKIERKSIKSAIQKLERPFSVYTPANYTPRGAPNALVILFDGEDLEDDDYQVTTLNNLIATGQIPSTIAVFVENLRRRRLVDLVADSTFADFLARELMPWLRVHYNVTKDPARVVVGGKSAGGLGAAYVAYRHPEAIGNVLSLSGAFWWSFEHNGGVCGSRCPQTGGRGGDGNRDPTTEGNYMAKQFLASPKLPLRFFLTAGTFEADANEEGGNILETTRQLRDILIAKGYRVKFKQFQGGHDGISWRGDLGEGLVTLLGQRHE